MIRLILIFLFSNSSFLLGRMIVFLPYQANGDASCKGLHFQMITSEIRETIEMSNEEIHLPQTQKLLEFIYEVYQKDETVAHDYLDMIRVQDQKLPPGYIAYVVRQNEISGEIDGVMRVMKSDPSMPFVFFSPYGVTKNIVGETPIELDHPELKEKLKELGPYVEFGRLATKPGADRIAIAISVIAKAINLLPGNTNFLASNHQSLAQLPPIQILVHTKDRQHKILYKLLGLTTFLEINDQEFIMVRKSDELKSIFSGDARILFNEEGLYDYSRALKTIEEKFLGFNKRFREYNQMYLYFQGMTHARFGNYQAAYEKFSRLDQLLPGTMEFIDLKYQMKILSHLNLLDGSNGDTAAIKMIFQEWKDTEKIVQTRTSHSVVQEFMLVVGLETENSNLLQTALSNRGMSYHNEADQTIFFKKLFAEAKTQTDFQHLWIEVNYFELDMPRNVFHPEFFRLKEKIARKLGNESLAQKYQRIVRILVGLPEDKFKFY